MAEKETKNKPKDLIEATPEEVTKLEEQISKSAAPGEEQILSRKERYERDAEHQRKIALESWVPKTEVGRLVKTGKEKDIDKILYSGKKLLEPEVVDILLPGLGSDLLSIGQSKGKFGGGKRRAWRQTQKKTMEGNVVTFSSLVVVGDKKGHVGIGMGKSKETLPTRIKATRKAKLSMIKITRGWESPEQGTEPHTVPFIVEGKCGSVRIKLIPAPRGTGLVVGDQAKKILRLAGIHDVYGVSKGQTRTTINLAFAVVDALSKTNRLKL
ncbi:MAG: 30S ribosomal protein S5 [Nanoarchaeota archaeon]